MSYHTLSHIATPSQILDHRELLLVQRERELIKRERELIKRENDGYAVTPLVNLEGATPQLLQHPVHPFQYSVHPVSPVNGKLPLPCGKCGYAGITFLDCGGDVMDDPGLVCDCGGKIMCENKHVWRLEDGKQIFDDQEDQVPDCAVAT